MILIIHYRPRSGPTKVTIIVPVDDPRLDPVAFLDPFAETNEDWEELQAHPERHFPSLSFPHFMTLMNQLANLEARHAGTNFIRAPEETKICL